MNYQTFSILQFRSLLKFFFHNNDVDLRSTSSEKTPLMSVVSTRLVLMFRKACNIPFFSERCYEMVASRQVENPFYRVFCRKSGLRSNALAQAIGSTANPFYRKFIVPTAKRVSANLLEIALSEIADLVIGEIFSRQLQTVWEEKIWEKNWVVVVGTGVQAESFQQTLQNKLVGSIETFFQNISLSVSGVFGYQPSVAVSGNLGGNVPVVDDVL